MSGRQPYSASMSCKVCRDTHTMTLREDGHEDREVMCTHCPTPCQKCRSGGNGPYCTSTPCECTCHIIPELTKNVLVKRTQVMDVSAFPMYGWACSFPGCTSVATLIENARHHENVTGYAHIMRRAHLILENQSDMTPTKFMRLVLEKYKDKPDDYVLSIGHWEDRPTVVLTANGEVPKMMPEFVAYMRVTVGEVKAMLGVLPTANEPFACPKCHQTSGNDWSQCAKSCPIPMSPHYSATERSKWKL